MPRKARADHTGQLLLPGMSRAGRGRDGQGKRETNAETKLMAAVAKLAAHRHEVIRSYRINAGLAFQGRRVFVFDATLRTTQGVIQVRNQWVMLSPRAIHLAHEGAPDQVHCLRGGRFLATEFKIGDAQPTASQAMELTAIREGGGGAYVISKIEHFERALELELGR